jgi:hypothetical protein
MGIIYTSTAISHTRSINLCSSPSKTSTTSITRKSSISNTLIGEASQLWAHLEDFGQLHDREVQDQDKGYGAMKRL